MELDNLKSLWKEVTEESSKTPLFDEDQLRELTRGKTQFIISKINRSIIIEVGSLLLFTLFFSVLALFNDRTEQRVISLLITVFCILSGIFYYYKYKSINDIPLTLSDLKTSLHRLIRSLNYFLNVYLYGTVILAPLSFLTGFFYGVSLSTKIIFSIPLISIGIGLAVVVTLVSYPALRWYLSRTYGKCLDQLKILEKELSEENS